MAPPWPGVACPGVSRPGVAAPAGVWLGVGSHMRVLGVAPGVSLPLGRPGVSSQRLFDGVCPGVCPGVWRRIKFYFLLSIIKQHLLYFVRLRKIGLAKAIKVTELHKLHSGYTSAALSA